MLGLIFVGLGIWMVVSHVRFQRGGYRAIAGLYFDRRYPRYVRQFPFALLPLGLSTLWMGGFGVAGSYVDGLGEGPGIFIFTSTVILILIWVAVRLFTAPPARLKPAWLSAEERDGSSE